MVYVYLAAGFEETEAVTIVDLLRRGDIEVKLVSVEKSKDVVGAHGISVKADLLYDQTNYEDCSMIVLPGGMPGTLNLKAHERLAAHIKCFAENGKWIAAICAAPMVLAGCGVLEGKKATIYPGMEGELAGAICADDRVVIDGKIITSKAPGTAMEFALKIVEVLKSAKKAQEVRNGLVIGDEL